MPQIIPLPGLGKISERFHLLIGLGIIFALCFYVPAENTPQSLAESCRESIGSFIWVPLDVLIAIIITVGIWTTIFIRCPKCTGRIRPGPLSDRRTVLYPCIKCDILWDSEREQIESSSSGG